MTKIVSAHDTHTKQVYHIDKDCPALGRSERTRKPTENEIEMLGLGLCQLCAKEVEQDYCPEKPCPLCGEKVSKLPPHLVKCEKR